MCQLSDKLQNEIDLLNISQDFDKLEGEGHGPTNLLEGDEPLVLDLPMTWDKGEEKDLQELPFGLEIRGNGWSKDATINDKKFSQVEYITRLGEVIPHVKNNADLAYVLKCISRSALLTDSQMLIAKEVNNPDAVFAAYSVLYQQAAFCLPEESTDRIIACIETIEDIMFSSNCHIDTAFDFVANIAIVRKNKTVVETAQRMFEDFINNCADYGVNVQENEDAIKLYAHKLAEKAKKEKNADALLELSRYIDRAPDNTDRANALLTIMAEAATSKELEDEMGKIITTLASVALNMPAILDDALQAIAVLLEGHINKQNAPLSVNALSMMGNMFKGDKDKEGQLWQIILLLNFCAESVPEQSKRIQNIVMNLEGLKPDERMKKLLEDLFSDPQDKEKGFTWLEMDQKAELIRAVDGTMQANADTVQLFIDKVSSLTDANNAVVGLVANEIITLFYKILGLINSYSNMDKISDDQKKKLKEEIVPKFIATFNKDLTQGTLKFLADDTMGKLKDLPDATFEFTLDLLVENIKIKDSTSYMPYINRLSWAMEDTNDAHRQMVMEKATAAYKNNLSEGDCSKLYPCFSLIDVTTKYPKEKIEFITALLTCDEMKSKWDDINKDIAPAHEAAMAVIRQLESHNKVTDKEFSKYAADKSMEIFNFYSSNNFLNASIFQFLTFKADIYAAAIKEEESRRREEENEAGDKGDGNNAGGNEDAANNNENADDNNKPA